MNREIKFRVWYSKWKTMSQVTGYLWEEDGINEENLEKYGYDERILMQYTGLKDKNGREIYEGDIVKASINRLGTMNYIIEWDIAGFNLKFISTEKYSIPMFTNLVTPGLQEIEIIGNIFETPSLLNENS
jgi:uncharacterized phage protein (TIGR01671 family)